MTAPLSVTKQALLAVEQLRARLAEVERAAREPIAIVGLGVRVPGARNPEAFWALLRDGVDATSDVPASRWDAAAFFDPDQQAPGRINTTRGGFIDDVDAFDADFFGVSPREARSMDPQHRVLLEVAWEALEDAGIAPTALAGTRTGVYVGLTTDDYMHLLVGNGEVGLLDAYAHHGNVLNAAAGRLSYVLGLQGPSMAIDTACSSSLVALHQACQGLRTRDCDLALAAGVNLILSPFTSVRLARGHMLAPDGRCKTFDAAADGYGRGEGCGVLVLKRLSAAIAEGDRVLAVIRGSAVNQDGHTSALTVPNGLAQRALIREALTNAGLEPSDVAYIEAHGTGTSLGDPIEMDAIADALGRNRTSPLIVGSVKTNIGHLESASGVAGVVKVALALQHGQVPAHLHFRTPSHHIPWSDLNVEIPTRTIPWPAGAPRIAGVSSFGASGTNAHAVLEAAPEPTSADASPSRAPNVLLLSAETDAALRELAARYVSFFDAGRALDLDAVCRTAASGRAHFTHRAAIVGQDVAKLRAGAAAIAAQQHDSSLWHSVAGRGTMPGVCFLFTGQGSQYWGMARSLFETAPAFRAALDECDRALRPYLDVPLLSVLYGEEYREPALVDRTAYTQPALFAIEYALARLLESWGVTPAAVIGHSVGEFAAACVAGVLSLEDAARVIAVRGKLMQALPEGGAMAAIEADEHAVRSAIAGDARTVAIAAVNASDQVVLSGDRAALEAVLGRLGVPEDKRRWLVVSHAFHSPLMQPMLQPLDAEAGRAAHGAPRVPFVSTLTGDVVRRVDSDYWRRHAAMPVRFADGVKRAAALGCSVFVEIGPSPTLIALAQRSVTDASAVWVPTLRRGRDDWNQMAAMVASLYVSGVISDGRAFGGRRHPVPLPTYPFARDRYWFAAERRAPAVASAPVRSDTSPSLNAPPPAYAVEWRRSTPEPVALAEQTRNLAGTWIVLAGGDGTGAALVESLRRRGLAPIAVTPGDAFERIGPGAFTLRPASGEDFDRLLRTAAPGRGGSTTVVYAWGTAPGSDSRIRDYSRMACGGLLELVQSLGRTETAARLIVLTEGAVAPGAQFAAGVSHQFMLWGFARTIAVEQPELRCVVADLDPASPSAGRADAMLADLAGGMPDAQVVYRGLDRYVPRLGEIRATSRPAIALAADATYLVTGGTGGAGLATAEWLAARGARQLALMARKEPSADAATKIRAIEQRYSASVRIVRADVADDRQLRAALAELAGTLAPLRGVVHAAGALADGLLRDQRWPQFESVLAAKVYGARNLHEATRHLPLDFFVMFSSFTGVAGSAGQANYTAANAFLDALAHERRAAGLPAVSIAWGPWQVGMLASLTGDLRERWRRQGLEPMSAERALSSIDAAVAGEHPSVAVLDIDWTAYLTATRRERDPFFAEIARAHRASDDRRDGAAPDLAAVVASAPASRRRTLLIDAIDEQARLVLGKNGGHRLDPRRPLRELGMDSLMAIEIRNAVGARLGRTLPATLLFDYPAIESVADYVLRTSFGDAGGDRPSDSERPAEPEMNTDADLIGLDDLSADEAEKLLLAELNAAED